MGLISRLFGNDFALQKCLVEDAAHVVPGAIGEHVAKIQTAVSRLDGYRIGPEETVKYHYGASTAAAVLAFKTRRRIINFSYQTQPDNIVGKMTIAILDKELAALEARTLTLDPSGWSMS